MLMAALTLTWSASADASIKWVDQYCSPSGDLCSGLYRNSGRMTSDLSTFSFRGKYQLCVKAPRATQDCKRFRLRRANHGILRGRVRLAKHFNLRRNGRYAVSFYSTGFRVGPALHFRKR